MSNGKQVYSALLAVQRDLKCNKNQFNSFGEYKYRSCEDIVEAVKPLLNDNGLILTMSDSVEEIGNRIYIKATASVIDVATGDKVEVTALAREPEEKKKMDSSQITGMASSYARKYALNGLFAIDDTNDADTDAFAIQSEQDDAQATERKNKGKSTNKDNKTLYNEADAVRKANINKLNAEIKRLGAKPEDVKKLAEFNFKKKSVNDMSDTEICVLTENLEKWAQGLYISTAWGEDKGALNND